MKRKTVLKGSSSGVSIRAAFMNSAVSQAEISFGSTSLPGSARDNPNKVQFNSIQMISRFADPGIDIA